MPTTNRFLTLNLAVRGLCLGITFYTIQVLSEGCPSTEIRGLLVQTDAKFVTAGVPFNLTISTSDGTPIHFEITITKEGVLIDHLTVERSDPCKSYDVSVTEVVLSEEGYFNIAVNGTNDVSWDFSKTAVTVQFPITDFRVMDPPLTHYVHYPVKVRLFMRVSPVDPFASNLTISKGSYSPTLPDVDLHKGSSMRFRNNGVIVVVLLYDETMVSSGMYYFNATLYNEVSSFSDYTTFRIVRDLSNVVVGSSSGMEDLSPGTTRNYTVGETVNFWCEVETGTIQWVTWTVPREGTFNTTSCDTNITLSVPGTFDISAAVHNQHSSSTGQMTVTVTQSGCPSTEISGLLVQTDAKFVTAGVPFNLTISTSDGTPIHFEITITKEGVLIDHLTVERSDPCKSYDVSVTEAVLSEEGYFNIAVNGTNDVSWDFSKTAVTVQCPITDFTVMDPPLVHFVHYPVNVTLFMRVSPVDPFPSNLTISKGSYSPTLPDVDLHKGSSMSFHDNGVIEVVLLYNETMATSGMYYFNATLYNEVSSFSDYTTFRIVRDLSNVVVRSSSGMEDLSPGTIRNYTVGETVNFWCEVETGTIQWVTWMVPHEGTFNTTSCDTNITLSVPGTFDISAAVHNQHSSSTGQMTVTVTQSGDDSFLTNPIANLTARTNSSYVVTGAPFYLTISSEGGTPTNYSIGTSRDGELINKTVLGGSNNSLCEIPTVTMARLVFSEKGHYLIQVCGTNDFSEACDEVDVVAQNPIEGALIAPPPPPVRVSEYLVTISINYQILPTSPQPNDIYLHFKTDLNNLEGLIMLENWDTDWPSSSRNSTFNLSLSFEEGHDPQGLYFISLRMFNRVSAVSSSVQVRLIQDLVNVTVKSSDGLEPKIGNIIGEYSAGRNVHFDCTVEAGTIEWVHWMVMDEVYASLCSWNFTFPSPGNFTVSATVGNRFSSAVGSTRVVIFGSVERFQRETHMIVADKYVKVNKPAIFRLIESDVPNLLVDTCTFYFGNETTKVLSSEGDVGFLVPYTFRMAGDYSVMVSCNTSEGALQDSILVQVSSPLEKLECNVTDGDGQLKSSYLFSVDSVLLQFGHQFVENVKYIFLLDGRYLNLTGNIFRHNSATQGTLSISGETIESSLQPGQRSLSVLTYDYSQGVQCTMELDLQTPITNISVSGPPAIVMTNATFDLTVGADAGVPVNLKIAIWRSQEKVSETVVARNLRKPSGWNVTTSLEMKNAGFYKVMVSAWNDYSVETSEWNVTAQNPVVGLGMDAVPPVTWRGSPTSVNVTVELRPIYPPPTDIFISIDFGDGRRETTLVWTVGRHPWRRWFEADFLDHGIYTIVARAFNDVSEMSASVDVHVLQEIKAVQLKSYSEMSISPHDIHTYPVEYPVYFNCSVSMGTIDWVTWEVNNDTISNTTACHWCHTFPFVGNFAVNATVSNVLFADEGSTTVTTLQSVANLHLVNNGPIMLNENITFVLFVGSLGTESSFRITFGDGQSLSVFNLTKTSAIGEYLKPGILLPFDPVQYHSAVVDHYYDVEGNFIAMAYGWNLVSSLVAISEVTVNLKPCEIPHLQVSSGGSNITVAPKFLRTHAIILHADVSVDCQGSDSTTYRWRLFKLDKIFPYPSAANEVHLPTEVKTHFVECYIPKFTLDYGEYVVELTVTTLMRRDGSVGMMAFDQSYLKVVSTPLVPRITGGSLRFIGWYSDVRLDGSTSYDPDASPTLGPDLGLTYTWYCRQSNETFPENLDDSECARCGCLGKGFVMSSDPSTGVTAGSVLSIPAQLLEGNKTYTFKLRLGKAGRNSETVEQTIKLLPGDVPSVLIRCIHNCDRYLNPSERFVLSGKCEDCTELSRPRYQWDLLVPDSVEELHWAFDWKRDTTTGKSNAYIVIKAGVFTELDIEDFVLSLHTYSRAGTSNFAEFKFYINSPPSGGRCFIAPSQGMVLQTYFYISCSRFHDVDTPLSFELRLMTKDAGENKGSLLHFGVDPIFPPTLLPVGDPSRDYIVDIALIVKDAFGAQTVSHLNATVKEPAPMEAAEMIDKVINMTQGKDSDMQQLLKSGDTQAATQLITTVSSILNSETEDDKSQENGKGGIETRIQVREQLITNLDQVEIRDLESLQLTSAAVAEVTQANGEISASAQLSATAIYHKMGSFLQAQVHEQSVAGTTSVAIEGTARQLVTGLANVLGAVTDESDGMEEKPSSTSDTDEINDKTRQVVLSSMETLRNIEDAILHTKVPGEEATVMKTDQVEVLLNRLEKWELDGKLFEFPGRNTSIKLPQNFRSEQESHAGVGETGSYDSIFDAHIHHFSHNPYTWSHITPVTSHVTTLDIIKEENEALEVSNLKEGVDLFLENVIDVESVTMKGLLNPDRGDKIFGFNVSDSGSAVMIHVRPKSKQESTQDKPTIEMTISDKLNDTETLFTFKLPHSSPLQNGWNETRFGNAERYSVLLDGDTILEVGIYFIQLEIDGALNWTKDWDVEVAIFSPQCYYWNSQSESWITDGCRAGPLTNLQNLHCICNHLSTFAGGYIPLPNAIDFKDDILLFAELFENPVTASTVLSVLLVFLLCAVWARRRDRKEDKEVEIIYLADNDPTAQYQYHVTVMTGMRRGAGTSSTVTITLCGAHGSSDPHVLTAPHRPVLQRGSVDSFMIATERNLGELAATRVWHDNSGNHPEWYVSRIIVHDLQNNRWWYFLCQSWLGVGFGDHSLDKTFPTASEEDLMQFHHLMLSKIQRDIKDQHLWVSVLVRPPHSNFTRLQRAACCLAIVLTAMLSNIIFYGVPEEYTTVNSNVSFGSLSLSWSSVVIGIESSLITFPINYLMVELFRNSKVRQRWHHGESVSLFTLSFSSLSQLTFDSAHSKISSLYASCRTFLSSGSNSLNMESLSNTSSTVISKMTSSGIHTESSTDSISSQKPLLGRRCLPATSLGSSFDSSNIADDIQLKTPSPAGSDEWVFIDSTKHKNSRRLLYNGLEPNGTDMSKPGKCDDQIKDHKTFENEIMMRGALPELNYIPVTDPNYLSQGIRAMKECITCQSVAITKSDCKLGDTILKEKHSDMKGRTHSSIISRDEWSSRDINCEETGETDKLYQKQRLYLTARKSQSSGYGSEIQVQRGLHSDDSLKQLIPPCQGEGKGDTKPFYPYHEDYLQSKLNNLKADIEALPEMEEPKRKRYHKASKKLDRILFLHGWINEEQMLSQPESEETDEEVKVDKAEEYEEFRGCLPWWTIYVSWVLVVITCLVSSFFIILYGLRYGKQQSLDWLMAMFISLFQSVAIIQPFKVVILAALFAILLPSHTHDQIGLGASRVINAKEVVSKGGNLEIPLQQLRNSRFYRPPPTRRVEKARKKRLARAKMYSLVKALLGQIAFIFLVLEIAYMQRDPNTYLMHETLANVFTEEADEVGTSQDLIQWVKEMFIPKVYGGNDGFVTDDLALRLGGARLRQLRKEEGECDSVEGMNLFNEVACSLGRQSTWGSLDASSNSNYESSWIYQPAGVLEGSFTNKATTTKNDRGGYALYLGSSNESALAALEYVQRTAWIDHGTKVMFIEWNLFNPHTNLLCICSLLFEHLLTGSFSTSFDFEVMRPLDMRTLYDKISLSLESIYIVVILALILIEVRKYRKNRSDYWDCWNLLTHFVIFLSLSASVVYILWLTSLWGVLQGYLRDPNDFHSFYKPAFLSQIFNYLVAFIVFFSSLKCAKVLRYNRTIHLMQTTLRFLTSKFGMSLLVVGIIFLAFSLLAFQMFGSSIYFFYSLVSSAESLFLFVSGGFDQFLEVSDHYPVSGPVFFILITFALIYIFMNLMIMFIVESFMRAQLYCKQVDHRDVVGALVEWFMSAFGVKTRTEEDKESNY